MTINPGSFRDPSGSVFSKDGRIYRSIFKHGVATFEAARAAGIYDRLFDSGLMISQQEVHKPDFAPEGTVHCLQHPRLKMISYPWEWPFSLLKDAALIHLDAMETLIPLGFWMRDASAYNVQYDGVGLRLIDTLSIGPRIAESPWIAYGQFCSHFLAPLAVAAYRDVRLLSHWRSCVDGFPLDFAVNILPRWRRYCPGLFMHLTLHSRFQKSTDRKVDNGDPQRTKLPKINDRRMMGLIQSLRRTIEGIKLKRISGAWKEYNKIRTYDDRDVVLKSDVVDRIVRRLQPKTVWDLGANTGDFSTIAAAHGAFTVGIDADPACVEIMYQKLYKEKRIKGFLPLMMDFANPSPGLGWDNNERFSLKERGPVDLVLALALIHHLVFTHCIPLPRIAEWIGSLTKYCLVEFCPMADPMVQKLLQNRGDEHHPYNLEVFKESFGKIFDFIDQASLTNQRTLFLCKRK
jgi:ribosomal protein L11 methylase PrmA